MAHQLRINHRKKKKKGKYHTELLHSVKCLFVVVNNSQKSDPTIFLGKSFPNLVLLLGLVSTRSKPDFSRPLFHNITTPFYCHKQFFPPLDAWICLCAKYHYKTILQLLSSIQPVHLSHLYVRITEWRGLEGTSNIISFKFPCHGLQHYSTPAAVRLFSVSFDASPFSFQCFFV